MEAPATGVPERRPPELSTVSDDGRVEPAVIAMAGPVALK